MLKKNTHTTVATQQVLMRLYQILLDTDKNTMFAKYNGEMEQTDKEIIGRVLDFQNTIRDLKKYAHRLKTANTRQGMI